MTDSNSPAPGRHPTRRVGAEASRKRGAPLGNTNALKHGFYSHWFSRHEEKRLDRDLLGQLADEEISLNIVIDRIFAAMKEGILPEDKILEVARAVSLAVGRIESIHRSRKAIYENQTTIQKALDELKYIPVDEG
ncbi:MAG: hypothetical protein NTV38_02505 [Chloroflexi bacterium]|nr:hypothetical protein [Chloroflexota bacterium]